MQCAKSGRRRDRRRRGRACGADRRRGRLERPWIDARPQELDCTRQAKSRRDRHRRQGTPQSLTSQKKNPSARNATTSLTYLAAFDSAACGLLRTADHHIDSNHSAVGGEEAEGRRAHEAIPRHVQVQRRMFCRRPQTSQGFFVPLACCSPSLHDYSPAYDCCVFKYLIMYL